MHARDLPAETLQVYFVQGMKTSLLLNSKREADSLVNGFMSFYEGLMDGIIGRCSVLKEKTVHCYLFCICFCS